MGETGRIWCGRAKVNLESTPCRCLTTRFVEFFYTNNSISATLTPVRFEVFITQLNAHLPHDQHHFALVSFISFDSFFVVSYASHTRVSWAIWHMMQVAHYRINQNPDGTCFIRAKQLFNSIPELIDHHKTKTSGLPVLLEYAISHLHLVSENQTARRLIVHDALCFLSTFPSIKTPTLSILLILPSTNKATFHMVWTRYCIHKAGKRAVVISKKLEEAWELPRKDIKMGKMLGAGNYGEVYKVRRLSCLFLPLHHSHPFFCACTTAMFLTPTDT